MSQLSIARLFDDNREKLKLEWIAGRGGATKDIDSSLTEDSSKGLIGHLNFIHPNLIQVLGGSEVALELISRGSGLIADDVVELCRVGPETIEGRCPPLLRDFLEVRGLGVLNVRTIFGEAALRPRKNLRIIVHLERPGPDLAPP